ncbi:MAG: hypothetical protein QOH03_2347, partial [Kribbellaceae bacterium]|nr:hypothetical protein [Kribbellaceae bacterium]
MSSLFTPLTLNAAVAAEWRERLATTTDGLPLVVENLPRASRPVDPATDLQIVTVKVDPDRSTAFVANHP